MSQPDDATYDVAFRDPRHRGRTITAAAVTTSGDYPGMLVFRDQGGTLVTLVNRDDVLSVDRRPPPPGPDAGTRVPATGPASPPPVTSSMTTTTSGTGIAVEVHWDAAAAEPGDLAHAIVAEMQRQVLRYQRRNPGRQL